MEEEWKLFKTISVLPRKEIFCRSVKEAECGTGCRFKVVRKENKDQRE
jgi:hypothetical protein